MSRRTARDDAALAEAFRRLDAGGPRTPRSTDALQTATATATTAEADAGRIDAALRDLIRPTAAPDTLAGRIAAEVARSRAAAVRRGRRAGWASRRPAWATALAAAAVAALLGGAGLAAMGGGGTIGARARGVGEWVRDVLGVGVRGDGGDGGAGVDDAAYYWVPGMGILPLRPDAVVATGPVTATVGETSIVVEGLVADARGMHIVVRALRKSSSVLDVYRRGLNDGTVWDCSPQPVDDFQDDASPRIRPDYCRFPPLESSDFRAGMVRFQVRVQDPEHWQHAKSAYIENINAFQAAIAQWLDVPIVAVASGRLKQAQRLGRDQTIGGVTIRARAVEPAPDRLAVRFDPVGESPADDVRFVPSDGGVDLDTFSDSIENVLSSIHFTGGTTSALRPFAVWEHTALDASVKSVLGGSPVLDLPRGHRVMPPRRTHRSWREPGLPATALFRSAGTASMTSGAVTLGPLLLAVDVEGAVDQPPLNGPNSATIRIDTTRAALSLDESNRMWTSGAPPDRYPFATTLRIADKDVLSGFAIVPTPVSGWSEERGEFSAFEYEVRMRWADDGGDGRQLVNLQLGFVRRTSIWNGFRRTCDSGTSSPGRNGPLTGPTPEMWMGAGTYFEDLPRSVTLCISRPIYQIAGPWTFSLDQR